MADELFDGFPITKHTIKVTKAGDGLSEALKINAHDLSAGDEGMMVLRFKVKGATMRPDKDAEELDGYERVDNLEAVSAKIIEGPAFEEALAAHEAEVRELRLQEEEARKGLKRIEFDPDEDAAQAAEDGASPGDPGNAGDRALQAVPPAE